MSQTRAERLIHLECRDQFISREMHALAEERERNRTEITRLRVEMSRHDRAEYEALQNGRSH